MVNKIRIGTRASKLAVWQANHLKSLLEIRFPGLLIEIHRIKTTGDNILDAPLSQIGSKGLFTKEIETALLDNSIDIAVHSYKDVPTSIPEGLAVGAVMEREDPHDIFIANPNKNIRSVADLPQNPVIATGSPRRISQLLNMRPDAQIIDVRGNIDTRLKKLDESDWDGIILAKAGVVRLGFAERITEILSFEKMLPAVGQGALAIEIRDGDKVVEDIVRFVHHAQTASVVTAERALLKYLEGGCQIPVGAYAHIHNDIIQLNAVVGSLDGKLLVRGEKKGSIPEADKIGTDLAKELFDMGGGQILKQIRKMF
jgi:hydroxymethylbilane synthase